jgi:hypothetical protein
MFGGAPIGGLFAPVNEATARATLDAAWASGIRAFDTAPHYGAGLVRELARLPKVSCKLSGLVTEAGPGWTADQIGPFAGHMLDWFGPERLMFGSGWPVSTATASYGEVLRLARSVLDGLSQAEQAAVLGGTATAVYRQKPPAGPARRGPARRGPARLGRRWRRAGSRR